MHTSIHGPQGASDESRILDIYEIQGMVVRKFAQDQRTKESLSSKGYELLQFVVELLQKQRVFTDDIFCTELVDGYVLEVPRMKRSMVFRDIGEVHSVVIRTPMHARCVMIDDENLHKDEIKEVLLCNLQEKINEHGMMETVAGTRNKPAPKMSIAGRDIPAWINNELQQLSPMELAMEQKQGTQRMADSISKIRERFPTARDFIGASDVGRMSKHLGIAGAFHGITDAVRIPGDRVLLAARIYGADDPAVKRANEVVMKERLETHRRARLAML
ncbi:MAG: hypothetical protein NTX63_05185 [Candidatus Peregrinibacteria bacterium]|nr:hypothetical protein [Candidatus Peregrinibacteria bacterium]